MTKPILCLDFDGVIHSYSSGWKGADVVSDPPVPGALAFMREALKTFRVAVYSSRSGQPGGIRAMQQWLAGHADKEDKRNVLWEIDLEWPTEKPPAMVTIDDRALTFDGSWPDIADLLAFQPWNKKPDRLGATGEFPKGALNPNDEGALMIRIGTEAGVVKIDFGKRVAWVGMPKAEAIAMAKVILAHAEQLPSVQ